MPDRGGELVDLFVRDLDQIELPPRDRWQPEPRKESYLMKTSRYVLYAVAAAAVLAAALIVGPLLRDRASQVATSPSPIPGTSTPIPASSAPATSVPTPSPSPTAELGAITGRFGYGSDFIPPVTVYAISTTDQRAWYSVDFAGFGNPPRPTLPPGVTEPTYTITGVASGTYWVVAYRNDGQLPDPGLYSRVNDCFRTTPSGPCPDGTLVPVTVIGGQTTRGIDVLTWGYPPPVPPAPTIPPRPTPRP
jgi:hypothetical protein